MEKKITRINWHALLLQSLVVFLGVTVAFLLNSWSADRHEKKMVTLYKQALLEDVKTNILETRRFIEQDSLWLVTAGNLLNHLDAQPNNMVDSLHTIYDLTTSADGLNPQKATYHSMETSGQLNLITDFHLKKEIVSYYNGTVFKVDLVEDYLWSFLTSQVIPHSLSTYDRRQKIFLNPDRDVIRYVNHLISMYRAKEQILSEYHNLLNHSKYLKDSIEENLD